MPFTFTLRPSKFEQPQPEIALVTRIHTASAVLNGPLLPPLRSVAGLHVPFEPALGAPAEPPLAEPLPAEPAPPEELVTRAPFAASKKFWSELLPQPSRDTHAPHTTSQELRIGMPKVLRRSHSAQGDSSLGVEPISASR